MSTLRALALRIPGTTVLALLRGYKWALSPLLLPACRYVPTCSEYAAEAVARHGAVRGSVMAICRLLRCHPFVRGGFDPVPSYSADTRLGRTGPSEAAHDGVCSHTSH